MGQYSLIDDNCRLLMTSRHGGVSLAPFDSMNCSHGVGDTTAAVAANRERVKDTLGVTALLSAIQVHGDDIVVQ